MLNLKNISIAAIAVGTIVMTLPAQAAISTSDKVETRISVIDLQTERGLIRVYEQLRETAERECDMDRFLSLREKRQAEECASDLLDDFVNSVDDIRLTRMHQEKTTG